jgi:hypothetical protein
MQRVRILLVRDNDYCFHVYQLAAFLARNGYDAEVLHTCDAEPESLYRDLIVKTSQLGIKCYLVKPRVSLIEQKLVSFASRLRIISKLHVIRPHKIRAARKALGRGAHYNFIVAVDPPSLFLACRLFRKELHKIINFSLEVDDATSVVFRRSRFGRSLRYFERAVQAKLYGLMIQDRFRAQVLLRNCGQPQNIRTIFYPVAMDASDYRRAPVPAFHHRQSTCPRQVRILFFGAVWSRELLDELAGLSSHLQEDQLLLVQSGRGSVRPTQRSGEKLVISTEPIPFDAVNEYIASADIGLAIYPEQTSNNSLYTAFASEKIARYAQCGIPFIAFENEDYEFLKIETGCCELVREFSEIPHAIDTILENYDAYRRGVLAAFDRFYSLDNSGVHLLKEISGVNYSVAVQKSASFLQRVRDADF